MIEQIPRNIVRLTLSKHNEVYNLVSSVPNENGYLLCPIAKIICKETG